MLKKRIATSKRKEAQIPSWVAKLQIAAEVTRPSRAARAATNATPEKIESDRAVATEVADADKDAKASREKAARLLKASRAVAKELEKVRGQQ